MTRRITILSAVALAVPMVLSTPAYAEEYGQHVADCAQTMGGFTGDHNPGTHQGYAGFEDHHCH